MLSPLRPRNRLWYALVVALTIAAGLASRHFSGFLPAFFGKYPGDVLWALMVFWGWGLLLPRASSLHSAVLALGVCLAIELLKLSQTPWLVAARQNAFGRLVFGQVFSWHNLIAYTVGVVVGYVTEQLCLRRQNK